MEKAKPFRELSEEVRKRPGAAEEIDARKRAILGAVRLAELRVDRDKTQAEVAALMQMTQANISRIERADNVYLQTLAEYVAALGGRLEINAVFDEDVVPLGAVDREKAPA